MLEYRQIIADIRDKKYKPVYILMGQETYFIDLISNYLADNALDESEKEFNQTILYGKETTAEQVISTVRSYPMMAERRVVIIREAQQFKELDKLEGYFQKPVNSTILVICHKYSSIDKRKKFFKSIEKNANVLLYDAKPMSTDDVVGWISKKFEQHQIRIQDNAAFILTELLGNDLNKLANEIEKMVLILPRGSEVKVEEVTDRVGLNREFNVFEFQSALGLKHRGKAFQMVNYFNRNPNSMPFPLLLGTLYSFFTKMLIVKSEKPQTERDIYSLVRVFNMKEFKDSLRNYPMTKVVEVIELLHEYDLRSKGVNNHSASHGDLMMEMTFRILN